MSLLTGKEESGCIRTNLSHFGGITLNTPTPSSAEGEDFPSVGGGPWGYLQLSKGDSFLGLPTALGKAVGPKGKSVRSRFPYLQNALIIPAQHTSQAGLEDQIKHTWELSLKAQSTTYMVKVSAQSQRALCDPVFASLNSKGTFWYIY